MTRRSSGDEVEAARVCAHCQHEESQHVAFSLAGDCGFWGCIACAALGSEDPQGVNYRHLFLTTAPPASVLAQSPPATEFPTERRGIRLNGRIGAGAPAHSRAESDGDVAEECGYCQEGRLRWRRRHVGLLVAIGLVSACIVVAGTIVTGDVGFAEMFLGGGVIGWLWRDTAEHVRRLSVPERCPVTDDTIRSGAILAFAKHLHEYGTTIQREKLQSIARAFIAARRAS